MQTPSPLHLLPFPKQALRQTGGARRLGKGPWKQVHLGPKRWLQSAACGLLGVGDLPEGRQVPAGVGARRDGGEWGAVWRAHFKGDTSQRGQW